VPLVACLLTCALLYTLSYFIENSFDKYILTRNAAELHSVLDSVERELSHYNSNKAHSELISNIHLILASHAQLFINITDDKNNTLYQTRGPNLPPMIKNMNINDIIANEGKTVWNNAHHSYQIDATTAMAASCGTSFLLSA